MAAKAALPAGTISCVFTDIEGSTRLLRELGEDYDALLELHQRALREVWDAHGGIEMAALGDGFFVVFGAVRDALRASVAAQRAMDATVWPTRLPVRIRIGIHTGFARPAGDRYSALVVHQAARIVDAAHGGQVLVSGESASAFGEAGNGIRLVRLGRFRVRDFDAPVELFGVRAPGAPAAQPAPRVRPADGHNLVRPPTSLVGRAADVAALGGLARAGAAVTVVGPGGVGKTRLAVETALSVAAAWPDGAWFVDLASIAASELVPEAVGDAVGAPSAPGTERWRLVCEYLADREALVVLDNCEHLADAAAYAAGELREACPGVGVLATSRVPLGLRGEAVYRLEPLAAGAGDAPAVELFLDRAAGSAELARETVAELCAELDGLPLAIELAAARTTAVTPAEILQRLRGSASVLRSRDPTLPERHRTLERLLDWGYDLLAPEARTVLGRLTAFAGDFDLEAAVAVAAAGDLDAGQAAELVWSLVDSSLVVVQEAAGASRYRLLSTVRAYALGRASPGERAAAVRRLARRHLERLGPARATGRAWLGEMATELDNVRGAAAIVDDPALAQALAWSVGRHHDVTDAFRSGVAEVSRWLGRLPARTPERVALLTLLADLHLRVAELDAAAELLAEAEALRAETGAPPWDEAGVARTRGELALRRGDPAAAADEARRALATDHLPRAQARLHNLLGIALGTLGDVDGAAEAFGQELRAASAAGAETFVPTTYANLAEVHLRLGDEVTAARHQERSLTLAREQRQPVLVAFGMMVAARLVVERGDPRRAATLQAAADELLAAASYALYEEDRRLRAALLEDVRTAVGELALAAATDDGRAIGADAAADLAWEVLAAVGSRGPDQETLP